MKSRPIRVGYQGECIDFITEHTSLLNYRCDSFASVLDGEEYSPILKGAFNFVAQHLNGPIATPWFWMI